MSKIIPQLDDDMDGFMDLSPVETTVEARSERQSMTFGESTLECADSTRCEKPDSLKRIDYVGHHQDIVQHAEHWSQSESSDETGEMEAEERSNDSQDEVPKNAEEAEEHNIDMAKSCLEWGYIIAASICVGQGIRTQVEKWPSEKTTVAEYAITYAGLLVTIFMIAAKLFILRKRPNAETWGILNLKCDKNLKFSVWNC